MEIIETIKAVIDGDLTILGFNTGLGQLHTSDKERSVLPGLQARMHELINDQAAQVKGEVAIAQTDDVYFTQKDMPAVLRNGTTVVQLTPIGDRLARA